MSAPANYRNLYRTSDIDTATVLKALGHDLLRVDCDKVGKSRFKTYFVFQS